MEFATFIKKWQNSGTRKLIFIIGGPLGFSDNVLSQNWKKLSLSRMTFTHEMALLVLLEQLYRAETINRGMIYHY
jgi:23S rRNA (pseudouridine1915-N3)-methyltransferase